LALLQVDAIFPLPVIVKVASPYVVLLASINPKKIFQEKVYHPLLNLLRQGTSPQKLSVAIAMGMVLGVMPAFGIVTALTALLAYLFRLNLPLMVGVTYLMSPFYVLLYVPFIRLGVALFKVDFPLTFIEIRQMFTENWLLAVRELGFANLMGLLVWFLVSVPVAGALYLIILPLVRSLSGSPETAKKTKADIFKEECGNKGT
jgi:uncharacterized protein (DUF2062 family)